MPLSKPPFYQQETPDSCVPACLRMVLAGLGMTITEAELRRLCDCTIDGTRALPALDAVRSLGFLKSSKQTLAFGELTELLEQGHYPIVFVEMYPIDGIYQIHALVILSISEFTVQVYDPARGERLIAPDIFNVAWKLRHHLALIVEP